MNKTLELPWGKDLIYFEIPENWNIVGSLLPNPINSVVDVSRETNISLSNPYGCKRLSDLAFDKKRILIVVDDFTRPTPISQLMPGILRELDQAGVDTSKLNIAAAPGVHRQMTHEEVAQRAGISCFNLVEHNADSPDGHVRIGTTSFGNQVRVNRTLVEADLIISVGSIVPHVIASFTGGYKNLIPGLACRGTIAFNHTLNCRRDRYNMVGQPIEDNPMRLDLEEAGRMLKAPVFMVNAVLNSSLEVIQVLSGDPIEAHRAGVKTAASIYGVRAPAKADIIISSSHPMNTDLRQGVNSIANTLRALKTNGVHLSFLKAEEGVGSFGLANARLLVNKHLLRIAAPFILPLVPRLKLKHMGEDSRYFFYSALQAMHRHRLLMYAPTIPKSAQRNMPFLDFVSTPQAGVNLACVMRPGKADVLVFPHGGSTFPILS